ncbi:hypothetical protein Ancab_001732, partial [Ancistrocladus abbreviatus]
MELDHKNATRADSSFRPCHGPWFRYHAVPQYATSSRVSKKSRRWPWITFACFIY